MSDEGNMSPEKPTIPIGANVGSWREQGPGRLNREGVLIGEKKSPEPEVAPQPPPKEEREKEGFREKAEKAAAGVGGAAKVAAEVRAAIKIGKELVSDLAPALVLLGIGHEVTEKVEKAESFNDVRSEVAEVLRQLGNKDIDKRNETVNKLLDKARPFEEVNRDITEALKIKDVSKRDEQLVRLHEERARLEVAANAIGLFGEADRGSGVRRIVDDEEQRFFKVRSGVMTEEEMDRQRQTDGVRKARERVAEEEAKVKGLAGYNNKMEGMVAEYWNVAKKGWEWAWAMVDVQGTTEEGRTKDEINARGWGSIPGKELINRAKHWKEVGEEAKSERVYQRNMELSRAQAGRGAGMDAEAEILIQARLAGLSQEEIDMFTNSRKFTYRESAELTKNQEDVLNWMRGHRDRLNQLNESQKGPEVKKMTWAMNLVSADRAEEELTGRYLDDHPDERPGKLVERASELGGVGRGTPEGAMVIETEKPAEGIFGASFLKRHGLPENFTVISSAGNLPVLYNVDTAGQLEMMRNTSAQSDFLNTPQFTQACTSPQEAMYFRWGIAPLVRLIFGNNVGSYSSLVGSEGTPGLLDQYGFSIRGVVAAFRNDEVAKRALGIFLQMDSREHNVVENRGDPVKRLIYKKKEDGKVVEPKVVVEDPKVWVKKEISIPEPKVIQKEGESDSEFKERGKKVIKAYDDDMQFARRMEGDYMMKLDTSHLQWSHRDAMFWMVEKSKQVQEYLVSQGVDCDRGTAELMGQLSVLINGGPGMNDTRAVRNKDYGPLLRNDPYERSVRSFVNRIFVRKRESVDDSREEGEKKFKFLGEYLNEGGVDGMLDAIWRMDEVRFKQAMRSAASLKNEMDAVDLIVKGQGEAMTANNETEMRVALGKHVAVLRTPEVPVITEQTAKEILQHSVPLLAQEIPTNATVPIAQDIGEFLLGWANAMTFGAVKKYQEYGKEKKKKEENEKKKKR